MRAIILLFLGFVCFVVFASAQGVERPQVLAWEASPHVGLSPFDYEISLRDRMIGKGGVTIAGGLTLTYFGSRGLIRYIRSKESDEYPWLDKAADLVLGYLGVAIGTVTIFVGTVYLLKGLKMPKQQNMDLGIGVGASGQLALHLTARW